MKLKVRLTFQDKETKKIYKPGQIIDIADEARVQDMLNRKLCEAVVSAKSAGKEKSASNSSKPSSGKTKFEKPAKVEETTADNGSANSAEGNPAEVPSEQDNTQE